MSDTKFEGRSAASGFDGDAPGERVNISEAEIRRHKKELLKVITKKGLNAEQLEEVQRILNSTEFGKTKAVLVIGQTGTGKSSFIRNAGGVTIKGDLPEVSDSCESVTKTPQLYTTSVDGETVSLLDCPGFADPTVNFDDKKIFEGIADYLYIYCTLLGTRFCGVLLMDNVRNIRRNTTTYNVVRDICGAAASSNIRIGAMDMGCEGSPAGTNPYEKFKAKLDREIYKGRHPILDVVNSEESATSILRGLIALQPQYLQLQYEMIQQRRYRDTTAGRHVFDDRALVLVDQSAPADQNNQSSVEKPPPYENPSFFEAMGDRFVSDVCTMVIIISWIASPLLYVLEGIATVATTRPGDGVAPDPPVATEIREHFKKWTAYYRNNVKLPV